MRSLLQKSNLALLCVLYVSMIIACARAQMFGEAKLVHEWKMLELDWPSLASKSAAITNKAFIPERNMVAGIKVYKNDIYMTIPRWFWTSGHPATLVKVITDQGQVKLKPYPTWAAQEQRNCTALQYVQGMEIDPNTGYMYVIDIGRIGLQLNLCPAKIVVYDLETDSEVKRYELSANVASPTNNFLNDIVLDYVDGKMRFAYITDANDARILVFDFQTETAFNVQHPSMNIENKSAEMLTINGKTYNFPVALDGIAIAPDFQYVYYCSLAGFNLYQIPTSSLRFGRSDGVRLIGSKVSQSGGIGYGSKHLFYGALGLNAVYFWDSDKDMTDQKKRIREVAFKTETLLVRNDSTMQWPDTLAFDNKGWIWFVSNRLQQFRNDSGLPQSGDAYMRVWKVFVNENGYLYEANKRTGGSCSMFSFTFGVQTSSFLIFLYLCAFYLK